MAQNRRGVLLSRLLAAVGEKLADVNRSVVIGSRRSSGTVPAAAVLSSWGSMGWRRGKTLGGLGCRTDRLGAGSASRDGEGRETMGTWQGGSGGGYCGAAASRSAVARQPLPALALPSSGSPYVILDARKWRLGGGGDGLGGGGVGRCGVSCGRGSGFAPERRWEREESRRRRRWTTAEGGADGGQEAGFELGDSTVSYLRNLENGAEVHLVGTAHISEKSATEVREMVRRVRPDYVMVELDEKRYEKLVRSGAHGRHSFLKESLSLLTQGKAGMLGKLIGVGLMGFYRLLANQGLFPGQEFKAAIDEAKVIGAEVVLGDRDVEATLRRLESGLTFTDVLSFFRQSMPDDLKHMLNKVAKEKKGQSLEAMVEDLKNRKMARRLVEEMEKKAPHLAKVMIDERNEIMVSKLRQLRGKVVAVVGLAHMDGIEALWHQMNMSQKGG